MANISYSKRKVKYEDLTPEQRKAEQIRKYETIWKFKKELCNEIHKRCGNDEHQWQIGERIASCSCYGEVKEYLLDGFRIRKTRKCHQAVCPACQASKSNTRVRNLTGLLELLNKERHEKGLPLVQVFQFEIVPKNLQDWKPAFRQCFEIADKCFGSHTRKRFFSIASEILGGTLSFECTINRKDGSKHPHFHGSVFVDPLRVHPGSNSWFDYEVFEADLERGVKFFNFWAFQLWEHIRSLGYQCFVHCAPAKNLYESVKYALKPNCCDNEKATGLKPAEALDAWEALKDLKKQTFRTFGKLRKIDLDDEKLLTHGTEYILYSFYHWDGNGKYVEETDGELHTESLDDEKDEKVLDKFQKTTSED